MAFIGQAIERELSRKGYTCEELGWTVFPFTWGKGDLRFQRVADGIKDDLFEVRDGAKCEVMFI